MLAKQLIEDGRLGEIRHYRGTYLQDWIVDPKFPLVWRLDRRRPGPARSATSRPTRSTSARFLVGEIAEVAGAWRRSSSERPLPGQRRAKTGT